MPPLILFELLGIARAAAVAAHVHATAHCMAKNLQDLESIPRVDRSKKSPACQVNALSSQLEGQLSFFFAAIIKWIRDNSARI